MKRLMMVMVIGMALAASGFAQERGGEHFSDGRGANGHFSGPAARGGRYDGGFSGYRRGDGGPRVGFGFSFAPAPGYVYPPSYVAPGYCPPVVGGVVVRGGTFAAARLSVTAAMGVVLDGKTPILMGKPDRLLETLGPTVE